MRKYSIGIIFCIIFVCLSSGVSVAAYMWPKLPKCSGCPEEKPIIPVPRLVGGDKAYSNSFFQGYRFEEQNNYDKALMNYNKALNIERKDLPSYYVLLDIGRVLYKKNNCGESFKMLSEFRRKIEDEDNGEAFLPLHMRERYKNEIDSIIDACSLRSERKELLREVEASLVSEEEKWDLACAKSSCKELSPYSYRKTSIDKEYSTAIEQGNEYERNVDLDKALASYKLASNVRRYELPSYYALLDVGRVLYKIGNYEQSLDVLSDYIYEVDTEIKVGFGLRLPREHIYGGFNDITLKKLILEKMEAEAIIKASMLRLAE